ncbi:bifunctional 4-hydroxy-2-oxoglutarate aldolase/2-dehydro-3-deoxy-phosphogluconate aldolase [Glaciibacter superstes]|uniref:bifunctional 4-hydroxy-2-oxoglutarate aldolase/2-dehydro-3-deoxy-phosphogluconate aldolase n=1 Tax=Glaciibacter superstes TaxID=501023 RepID=UPI0003B3D78E|nr:bifunctional 4-hydroxy-2-oxoglutarate aldolase/2-dehydro-3-deoxy-phosphogluconate aldolase [Glaciibacter superstes]
MLDLISSLAPRPVIAILRAPTAEHFHRATRILIDGGITTVEYTLTTRGALEALESARSQFPDAILGAGTVRSPHLAQQAVDSGAQFLVSQLLTPEVVRFSAAADVPMVPGCLTPNEIADAWELGVSAVKISPIDPVGGAAYLREVRGPLPEIPIITTGGIRLGEIADYLDAGAAAVGLSGHLFGSSLLTGDVEPLRARATTIARSLEERIAVK